MKKARYTVSLLLNGKSEINGYGYLEISSMCEIDLICSINSCFDLLNAGEKKEGKKEEKYKGSI